MEIIIEHKLISPFNWRQKLLTKTGKYLTSMKF